MENYNRLVCAINRIYRVTKKNLNFSKKFFQTYKIQHVCMLYSLRKEGKAMQDKLTVSERRINMLKYLSLNRKATRLELSMEFNVSVCTIAGDIIFLSKLAPIYTKQGNKGGVYILPEYRSYSNYLTKEEEEFLQSLMERVGDDEKKILAEIITKFSMRNAGKDEVGI